MPFDANKTQSGRQPHPKYSVEMTFQREDLLKAVKGLVAGTTDALDTARDLIAYCDGYDAERYCANARKEMQAAGYD